MLLGDVVFNLRSRRTGIVLNPLLEDKNPRANFMKMKYPIIVALLFILASCHKTEVSEFKNSAMEINLDYSTAGKFSEIASSVEYVVLESTEENPIVWPLNLKTDRKGNFYLRDFTTHKLLVFDTTGKLTLSFSPKGKGPQEYFQISDFQLTEDKIIILDTSISKILEFDHQGIFLGEHRFGNKFFTFFMGNDFVLNFSSYSPDFDQNNFVKTDLSSGNWEGCLRIEDAKLNIGNFVFQNGFMSNYHNHYVYFNIPFSTQVARFDGDSGDLNTVFDFDFGRYALPVEYYRLQKSKMYELQERGNLVRQINAFFPFKDFYLLNVSQGMGRKSHYILLSNTGEVLFQKFGLINDLDEMEIDGFPWSFSQDEVIFMLSSNDFLDAYTQKFLKGKKNPTNGIHDFVKRNEELLRQDTKVLVKFKLKTL